MPWSSASFVRFSVLGVVLVVAFGLGVGGLARVTPTSFLPEEDQGAFFVQVQLPDGVSVARTSEVVGQVEAVLKSMPQVKDTVVDHRLLVPRFVLVQQHRLHGGRVAAV